MNATVPLWNLTRPPALLIPPICVEIKSSRRLRAESSRRPPSTRRLLDGVAMPVPHRSTEPARQRHEMTVVDFHTAPDAVA